MILDFVENVPPSLAPFCAAMTVGCDAGCARACGLAEPKTFDAALAAFAEAYHEPDRGALVSLWSMYYLAALVVPTTVALLCGDRVLPVAFDELGLSVGGSGLAAFRLADAGRPGSAGDRRFEAMVEGHLAPFSSLCADRAGLSPRVIWSNAAVTLDWVLGELPGTGTAGAARAEAESLLAGRAGACRLAHPMRTGVDGTRTRRVCCLRYRLRGVGDCGGLCARARMASMNAAC